MLSRTQWVPSALVAFISAFSLGLALQYALGQSPPRDQNKISLLRSDNSLVALPLEAGTVKVKTKFGGVLGGKVATEIPGGRSTVRLRAGEQQTFVLGLGAYGPTATFDSVVAAVPSVQFANLHKLEVNKKADTRDVLFSETTGFAPVYTKNNGMADSRGIPLNFSRFDDHSVRIEPRSPLSPGEYAFLAVTTPTDPYAAQNQTFYYCFGVE